MRWLSIVGLAVAVVGVGGCVVVKPYQREHLAMPGMTLAPTPDIEAEQHLLESRESSTGGYGIAAGGCGCN